MAFDGRQQPIGMHAIDSALRLKYPNKEPMIYAPMINLRAGGDDPLEQVAIYERTDPMPHWHFITYGFSDVFEKSSKTNSISGFGFELTFRLVKPRDEEDPPEWVVGFLQNLARFVFSTGNRFDNGFHFDLNRDINFGQSSELSAVVFAYDPELKAINTPNGILVFLQVIGLTKDEKMAMQSWNSTKFVDAISNELPLLITDPTRGSLLSDEKIRKIVEKGIETDGSSTETLVIKKLGWKDEKKMFNKKNFEITIGSDSFAEVNNLLRWRLMKGRDLTLIGPSQRLTFCLRDQANIYVDDFEMKLYLDPKSVKDIVDKFSKNVADFELASLKNVRLKIE